MTGVFGIILTVVTVIALIITGAVLVVCADRDGRIF